MKTFCGILFLTLFALCTADISLKLKEQEFTKTDEHGGYHFGFNDGRVARQEEGTPEGIVRGAYRYVDANGEVQTIKYTADKHNGYVASGPSIPKVSEIPELEKNTELVVEDTPEVKAAKAEHLEAHKNALSGENVFLKTAQLPTPVQYTPEVAAARAQHFNALDQERLRNQVYQPITYVSQPALQYVVPAAQYHPEYLPYVGF